MLIYKITEVNRVLANAPLTRPWRIKFGRDAPSLKVVRPLDASKLPPYAAVNYVISDTGNRFIDWRSHLSGGGINASPITPGRSYLSSSLTFKLTDPSVFTQQLINFKRLLLNRYTGSDILRFFFEKFYFESARYGQWSLHLFMTRPDVQTSYPPVFDSKIY